MATGRATIIDAAAPLRSLAEADAWLQQGGEAELTEGLRMLNRALHAFRLVMADPYINQIARRQLLVARLGYGAGEQVADGLWSEARELLPRAERQPRQKVLQPQARLAALLGGRERALACEELVLRARLDLDSARPREAALGVLVALDAALAEVAADPVGVRLAERLEELRGQRDPAALAAQAALSGALSDTDLHHVTFTIERIEAALRARAVATA
ncbi:MAG: hypothetical protein M3Z27_00275 [Actinomycetota bacterium]|nr:hypothetical protein [Actinomycetota bacterium]